MEAQNSGNIAGVIESIALAIAPGRITVLEVPPLGFKKLVLGPYKTKDEPKVSITMHDVNPAGALVQLRDYVKAKGGYNLLIILENFGNQTATVVIRQA